MPTLSNLVLFQQPFLDPKVTFSSMQTYDQVCLNVHSAVAHPCMFCHIMREMNAILNTLLDIFKSYRCTTLTTFLPKMFLLNLLKYP